MRPYTVSSRQLRLHVSIVRRPPPPPTPPRCGAVRFFTASPYRLASLGRIHPVPASSRRSHISDPVAPVLDQFDIPTSDPTPRTPTQRLVLRLRQSGRVVFAVVVAAAGVVALGSLGYTLLLDPAHSAHSHSFHFLQHHPTAVAALGGGRLLDMSDPMRQQLCRDAVRQVGGEQWAQCEYRVRGDAPQPLGREGDVTAVLKRNGRGGSWLVVYVTLDAVAADGRRQRVVVCDYRAQVQQEQRAALAT